MTFSRSSDRSTPLSGSHRSGSSFWIFIDLSWLVKLPPCRLLKKTSRRMTIIIVILLLYLRVLVYVGERPLGLVRLHQQRAANRPRKSLEWLPQLSVTLICLMSHRPCLEHRQCLENPCLEHLYPCISIDFSFGCTTSDGYAIANANNAITTSIAF